MVCVLKRKIPQPLSSEEGFNLRVIQDFKSSLYCIHQDMWEQLIVYNQLDKKDIRPTFEKFVMYLQTQLPGYNIEQFKNLIILFRADGEFRQAIYIEKRPDDYSLKVYTIVEPVVFSTNRELFVTASVPLGTIMNNYRRSFYPLTKEWQQLVQYLANRIKNEIEEHFQCFDSYAKIIAQRTEIENSWFMNNHFYSFHVLLYAAIKTRDANLLNHYLDKIIDRPVMKFENAHLAKEPVPEFPLQEFAKKIRDLSEIADFNSIEKEIEKLTKQT